MIGQSPVSISNHTLANHLYLYLTNVVTLQVRVADNHAGGGTMSILTPSCTHEIRSKDGTLLHR